MNSSSSDRRPTESADSGYVPRQRVDSPRANLQAPGARLRVSGPPLRREKFLTSDPETARRFFATAYSPDWRFTGLVPGAAVRHLRYHAGEVRVDEVTFTGAVECAVHPSDDVVVISLEDGYLRDTGDARHPSINIGEPLLVTRDLPAALHLSGARVHVVSVGPKGLRRAAAESTTAMPDDVRFATRRAATPGAIATWRRTLDYAKATFAAEEAGQHSPTVTAAARALSAATLECFVNNVVTVLDSAQTQVSSEALSHAMAFVQDNAAGTVSVKDIAAAVHLTTRSVQYLFRRELDSTPTEYLRKVRLHRAHEDLIARDHTTTTIREVAARWGFLHTGRFAVLYRETYGQSPHTTLRQ